MVEKRKRSSATTHVRASSAASQSTTPVPQSTPPVTVAQPEIPTSFVKDGPLPVISARQPDDLSLKDFKSVAESKVLAESLARSQRRWADGDIFERVWIKPLKSRKLNPADVERNLSKESMVRLGACTMTCMPHQFDMKLWALVQPVKAPPPQTPPPPPPLPPPSQSQVTYHQQPPQGTALQPIQQAGPSHPQQAPVALPNPQGQSVSTPQRQAPQAVATITPVQIPRPPASVPQIPQPNGAAPVTPNSSIVPKTVPTPQSNLVAPSPQQQPQPQPQQVQRHTVTHAQLPPPPTPATALPPRQTIATPQRPPPQHIQPPPASPHPPQGPQGPPPPQNARSGPDPVIQMLAMKAATDQNLKQLMRIVASGRATKEQLQEFQGHIDILTSESNLNNQQSQGPPPPPPPGQPPPGQMYHHSQQPPPHQMMPHPMYQQPPHPQQMYQQPHPQYQQYPQHGQQRPAQYQQPPPPKPRAFPQAPKQEVVGVLLEFVDNYSHGDRFLFPKHAILEYLDGGTTLRASFIVTQKLSEGSTDEYYQPTTVIFKASTAKTLETFGKVVADPETTRTHMKEVMSKMKRAEDTFLVYRLRREPGEPVPSKASVETKMPPPTRHRKRDVSTPNVDTIRSSASNAQSSTASRPRVKNVKKHVPQSDAARSSASRSTPAPAPAAPSPPPQTPTPVSRGPKPTRSRKGRIADPTKTCHICQTSQTSLWRKADIDGESTTVCNACGIKWKTNAQKQAQIAAAIAKGEPIPEDSPLRRNSSTTGPRPSLEQLQVGAPQMPFEPVDTVNDSITLATPMTEPPPAVPAQSVVPPGDGSPAPPTFSAVAPASEPVV